jgi:hypothetical protein
MHRFHLPHHDQLSFALTTMQHGCQAALVPLVLASLLCLLHAQQFVAYGGNTYTGLLVLTAKPTGLQRQVVSLSSTSYAVTVDAANSSEAFFQQGFFYHIGSSVPLSSLSLLDVSVPPVLVRHLPDSDGNNLYVDSSLDLVVWECYINGGAQLTACWSSLRNESAPIFRMPGTFNPSEMCGFEVYLGSLYTCALLASNHTPGFQWSLVRVSLNKPTNLTVLSPLNGAGGIAMDRQRGVLFYNDFPVNVVRADVYALPLNGPTPAKAVHLFTTTLDYLLNLAYDATNNLLWFPIEDSDSLYTVNLSQALPLAPTQHQGSIIVDPSVQLRWAGPMA